MTASIPVVRISRANCESLGKEAPWQAGEKLSKMWEASFLRAG